MAEPSAQGSEEIKPVQQPNGPRESPAESTAKPVDAAPMESKPARPGPPMAGIVASAGGLDAYREFFTAMPFDSGIAFVLVPHLDPARESLLVELLAKHTLMPVVEAEDGLSVEANRVYITPPNKYVTIESGVLRLSGLVEPHAAQTSIDVFLRSLADDQQERSIGILLSGTGSHGTLGLKAVKAAGGLVMVQDPATAKYARMPQSAVDCGLADFVLPAEQMPDALLKYVQHGYLHGGTRIESAPEAVDHLTQVLTLLRFRTKFDFSCYRKKMLLRRIERRMVLKQKESIPEYVALLREHPEEAKQLIRDLFISVTNFFRDPEAFEQLASQVLAPLVQHKANDEAIRVWVPGCATGEEPYSIAMLLQEQLEAAHKTCRVQIYATDVDEDALAVARKGIYPDSITADVSPDRLGRFFVKLDDEQAYQVSKSLRDMVTFGVQNLLSDAPFSKTDLISCRNLLIYLEANVQRKLLTLFHFALNSGGFLFLGSSETIGGQIDLFEPLSKKWRIFRRIGPPRPELVDFPIVVALDGPGVRRRYTEVGDVPPIDFADITQRLLLEQYAPASVLINRKYEIFYYYGPCARFLEFPTGKPTHDLLRVARDGLRSVLRGAIHRAIRDNENVVLTNVPVRRNGDYYPARVSVRPIRGHKVAEGLLLITFEEDAVSGHPPTAPLSAVQGEATEKAVIQQLEYELTATREDLQNTIEELESSNEELKGSHEEVLSMNEELQSLNEELSAVNSQLQDKVEELEMANNDMANLLRCTEVATVFLDNAFCIKLFTPAADKLFHLVASDRGRPLGDIKARFPDPELLDDAQMVLQQLLPREKEISTAEGCWYVRRINPYRTRDNRIEGVVITFVDITERKKAADAVVRRLAAIVESSVDAIFSMDLDGIIQTWNRGAERLYGYTAEEAIGQSMGVLVPADRAEEGSWIMAKLRRGESVEGAETERVQKDGKLIPIRLTVSPLRDSSGEVASASSIARDISESKRAEQELRDREGRLRALLETAADAIITIDQHGIIQSVNPAAERMFGYTAAEMVGQNVKMLMPSPFRETHDSYLARYLQTGEKRMIGVGMEVEARRKNGSVFPADLAVSEVEHQKLFTGIIRDITRRRELECEVVEVASVEQRRIGQDLHDSVGQELTALNLLAKDLFETLPTDPANAAPLVKQMLNGLQRAQKELRTVLRGLLPVAVDTEGLMAALADLADRTKHESKVSCVFDCPTPVAVADNLTATHLYLIAQEAVHNALKHARAKEVRIALQANGGLVLRIQDDGIGMPAQHHSVVSPSRRVVIESETSGLGLRIMHNRAAIIGAQLTIEPTKPTGTLVTCVLVRGKNEPAQDEETNPRSDRR